MSLKKVISGGQSGADFAGLLAAKAAGIETGGYAPKGWKTEKGPKPELSTFGLIESHSMKYDVRTAQNIKLCDGVLIATMIHDSPGSRLTQKLADEHKKKVAGVSYFTNARNKDETQDIAACRLADWIFEQDIQVLNVAGNRESVAPGLQVWLTQTLIKTFKLLEERYHD